MEHPVVLPAELSALLERGEWATGAGVGVDPRISRTVAAQLEGLPEPLPTTGIHLHQPLVLAEIARHNPFWHEFGAMDQIEPSRCLVIGDFGIGSDSPIALDYRSEPPCVIALRWLESTSGAPVTRWETIASDFDTFVEAIGLRPQGSV